MRGSLHKASMKRGSLPKGQFRWNIMLSLGRAEDGKSNRSASASAARAGRRSRN